MSVFEKARRIVIKVGSSSLTYDTGMVNIRQIEKLCKILSDIKNSGRQVILVTSGAIPVGASKLGLAAKPTTMPEKQAAGAGGQWARMYVYDKHFLEYHHKVAQILLTRDIIEKDELRTHAVNTFETLLKLGAIPIVNENDTIAVDEIRFGDNDTLSAIVASLTKADGLFEENPKDNPDAKIIPLVTEIDDHIRSIAGGAGSNRGTGGMATKIAAAEICFSCGCSMAIINSSRFETLYDILEGKQVGTLFERR